MTEYKVSDTLWHLDSTYHWENRTDNFDASTLNPEQQKMLFLANYLQKPGESSGMYGITDENLPEWWAREHWAGAEEDKPERLASFEGNMNVYGV